MLLKWKILRLRKFKKIILNHVLGEKKYFAAFGINYIIDHATVNYFSLVNLGRVTTKKLFFIEGPKTKFSFFFFPTLFGSIHWFRNLTLYLSILITDFSSFRQILLNPPKGPYLKSFPTSLESHHSLKIRCSHRTEKKFEYFFKHPKNLK